jgi:FixJ family two-component response regulator
MNVAEPAHILVVDDEPDLRELVTDALTKDGLDVASAANGAQACELAERRRPDLVVADIRLPDCTGLEIVDKLRASVGDVPTVVITGTGDVRWASEACRRGCVDFLTKPLDLPRLCGAIRRELSRRRRNERSARRTRKLRRLARELSHRRRNVDEQLNSTCAALTSAYHTLSRQLNRQDTLLRFQRQLMACRDDDDIFRQMFNHFCQQGENLFGVALACDEDAGHARRALPSVAASTSGRYAVPVAAPVAGRGPTNRRGHSLPQGRPAVH